MSNKKQSSVEWLIEQLKEQIIKSAHRDAATIRTGDYRIGLGKAIELCEQAKEMEREQITEAFKEGVKYWNGDEYKTIDIEQYYNETYEDRN